VSDAKVNSTLKPSNTSNPDLDSSQVREMGLILNLAIAQITSAMNDSDDSISKLADSFTSMIGNAEKAHLAAEELPDSIEKSTIINSCLSITDKMQHSIIAFQFYDTLSQRLSHVSNSLSVLADLVSDSKALYTPYDRRGLQEKIKSNFSDNTEKLMYEFILQGRNIDEALAMVKQAQQKSDLSDNDDELF